MTLQGHSLISVLHVLSPVGISKDARLLVSANIQTRDNIQRQNSNPYYIAMKIK